MALPVSRRCFRWSRWWLPSRKAHRRRHCRGGRTRLGAGRISTASEYVWYALALGVPLGLATTAAMHALGPTLYARMGISGNALEIAISYSSTIFAGATLIWLFNSLMAVVRPRQPAGSGDRGLRWSFDPYPLSPH